MVKVIFVDKNGAEQEVDIASGKSLMEGAVRANVRGLDADCGGACSCATCMVFVPEKWRERVPAKSSDEDAMLQFSPHVDATSRLSCQIVVDETLEGLRVLVPASQH